MQIADSVALVTGANRGLGRAFVEGLLARGARRVYAAARVPERVAVDDPRIVPVRLDVTEPAALAAAAHEHPEVTLLVNNAGTAHAAPLLAASALDWLRADLETNAVGLLAVTAAFAPILERNGGGAIINVLSVASFRSMRHIGGYSASKAAAWSLTNGLRAELPNTLITAVHCGFVDTDMAAEVPGEKLAPSTVVDAALDGVAAGQLEVLVDELSAAAKRGVAQAVAVD